MIYFKNFLRAKTLHTKNVAACNGFSITEPPHSFGTEGLNISKAEERHENYAHGRIAQRHRRTIF